MKATRCIKTCFYGNRLYKAGEAVSLDIPDKDTSAKFFEGTKATTTKTTTATTTDAK